MKYQGAAAHLICDPFSLTVTRMDSISAGKETGEHQEAAYASWTDPLVLGFNPFAPP